ncbi:MAG: peptidoglycan-binding domain-containing protein [Planctomycetota bacterium]|jgi:peptidoglycan hydrolase-like protein with peptidoglycan-binding domain
MTSIGSGVGPIGGSEVSSVTDTASTETSSPLSSGLSEFAQLVEIAQGNGQIGNNERGDYVAAVQQSLIDLLGEGAVGSMGADGWWGSRSAAGVGAFQEQNGLAVTGFVDQDTLLAIDNALTEAAGGTGEPETATQAMTRTLNEAVEDGLLGAAELQQAEADISAKYGPEVAKDVLLEAFGAHAGKLDMAAVKFLQGKMGSMEGHIGRYQDILDENLAGAQILDLNQDGNIDKGDLVFSEGADGAVNIEAPWSTPARTSPGPSSTSS